MSGVYQIYNTETNKRYIGSSIDVQRRLKEHLRNLKANRHCNQHLQNAWNRYREYLVFEPLEYCEPDQCLKLEQQYIDYYNSADRKFGYNIDPQAASAGKHLSEETKQKISKANKGKKLSPEVIEKIRTKNLGKKKPKQSKTMKQKYQNGYQIPRFTDMPEDKKEQWRKHLSEGTIKRYSDFNNRPEGIYLKCIFSNDIKYYHSLREASRTLGIDKGGIKYVIQHKEGYMKKLNCTFVLIDKIEFLANKVVGEK